MGCISTINVDSISFLIWKNMKWKNLITRQKNAWIEEYSVCSRMGKMQLNPRLRPALMKPFLGQCESWLSLVWFKTSPIKMMVNHCALWESIGQGADHCHVSIYGLCGNEPLLFFSLWGCENILKGSPAVKQWFDWEGFTDFTQTLLLACKFF